MANNSYAFTESAIFCQHASLALLGATVLPLAVICFLNSSYEFIITTCSSWVTYIARVRSVRSIASRWMTLGYALFMWTRIETKAENLAWQIYFKWASWNRLTLIASFVFSNPGFPKKARICSASFVVHPPWYTKDINELCSFFKQAFWKNVSTFIRLHVDKNFVLDYQNVLFGFFSVPNYANT